MKKWDKCMTVAYTKYIMPKHFLFKICQNPQDLKTKLELNLKLVLKLSVMLPTWEHLVFKTCLWHLEVSTHSITVYSACLLHFGGLVASILIKIFLIPHIAFSVCMQMPFTLGILYFLQMPIYFKFRIEVHLRKLQFWKNKPRKNTKTSL